MSSDIFQSPEPNIKIYTTYDLKAVGTISKLLKKNYYHKTLLGYE